MNDLATVRRLQIIAKQRVLDLFYGAYRSAFKGRGIEVEDIREYIPGDDIRAMSWAKTASSGKPFVKTFREERDLTVTLVVDISASVLFGSEWETKRKRVAEIGALLAFSAIFNHDKVSLLLFSDGVERYIPPKRGNKHGIRLIRELLSYKASQRKTDIAKALQYLHRVQRKRSIVFLISDFLSPAWEKAFLLAAKKDDLIAILVQDVSENLMPAMGLVSSSNLETDEELIIDFTQSCVQASNEEKKRMNEHIRNVVNASGASCLDIRTDSSYDDVVLAFFKRRAKALER